MNFKLLIYIYVDILSLFSLKINFNWAFLLLFISYWNYGFYGSVFTQDIRIDLFIYSTFILSIIIFLLSWVALSGKKIFIVRDTLYSVRANQTLTEIATILYEFNKILKKELPVLNFARESAVNQGSITEKEQSISVPITMLLQQAVSEMEIWLRQCTGKTG